MQFSATCCPTSWVGAPVCKILDPPLINKRAIEILQPISVQSLLGCGWVAAKVPVFLWQGSGKWWVYILSVADLKSQNFGRPPPLLGPIVLIFMQFVEKFG